MRGPGARRTKLTSNLIIVATPISIVFSYSVMAVLLSTYDRDCWLVVGSKRDLEHAQEERVCDNERHNEHSHKHKVLLHSHNPIAMPIAMPSHTHVGTPK
jgi:hypothetical protein